MIRVMLADDHSIVRAGLCRIVQESEDMKVQRVPGEPILLLEGEFTQSAEQICLGPLQELLSEAAGKGMPVILDFQKVPYMDSAGFSRWVSLERMVHQQGRDLRVRGASSLIRDLFHFADLEDVLEP